MKLKDLKVINIIQMPQFEKHIEALIKDLDLTRTKIMNEHPGVQFKRGPVKRLQEKKVLKFLWRCVGILYFPIYLLAWVLHKIARLTLAIAYFGLLNKQAGKDIIKSLFKWHGRY